MDIIAGITVTALIIILFFVSEKIQVPNKIYTAILFGFITFIIFTNKNILLAQKIGVIFVTLLLIFAVNLKIKKPGEDHSDLQIKDKPKKS